MSAPNDFGAAVAEPRREEFEEFNARFLWAHLVSRHAVIIDIDCSTDELTDLHDREHSGPGSIRNHPKEDRSYSLKRLGEVLGEAEE